MRRIWLVLQCGLITTFNASNNSAVITHQSMNPRRPGNRRLRVSICRHGTVYNAVEDFFADYRNYRTLNSRPGPKVWPRGQSGPSREWFGTAVIEHCTNPAVVCQNPPSLNAARFVYVTARHLYGANLVMSPSNQNKTATVSLLHGRRNDPTTATAARRKSATLYSFARD